MNAPVNSTATVLVVDDMSSMRAITKKILKHFGYTNVLECENGKQALSRLKASRIDLVICDWDMPVMTGYELLQAVKSSDRLSKIPFIMLTANASGEFVSKCVEAKVSDYIVKPFQPNAFIERVKKHI